MSSEIKPKAREGLLTSDHSKRGKRYLAVLDPSNQQITLLEPWEHAVLILCDGTRDAAQITKLLGDKVEGEPIDLDVVRRCLKFFERDRLINAAGLRRPDAPLPPAGARTLAGLQQAYREWHKDPVKTGQILSGLFPPPFTDPAASVKAGLDPTVALPDEDKEEPRPVAVGSMLVLAEAESLLGDVTPKKPDLGSRAGEARPPVDASRSRPGRPRREEPETLIGPLAENTNPDTVAVDAETRELASGAAMVAAEEFEADIDVGQGVAELLAAVDDDFAEVESREKTKKKRVPPPPARAWGGEAELPMSREIKRPPAKVVTTAKTSEVIVEKLDHTAGRVVVEKVPSKRSVPLSESALRPTMVGLPPDAGASPDTAPVILVPPRALTPRPSEPDEDRTERPTRRAWTDQEDELTTRLPLTRRNSDITPGAIIQDMSHADGPTEGMIVAFNPDDVPEERTEKRRPRKRRPESPTAAMRPKNEDPSNPSLELNLPSRAREVFERLRKAGLRARTGDDSGRKDGPARSRRKDDENARRFDEALKSLSAGELEVALKHFRRLHEKMPESKRLAAFIEAIEAVRTGGIDPNAITGEIKERASSAQFMLDEFEGVLEEAVAYGRCPACFSMVAKNFAKCFACGFELGSK